MSVATCFSRLLGDRDLKVTGQEQKQEKQMLKGVSP
jgi:hypothetical protein